MFVRKVIPKIFSKFTRKHPCRSVWFQKSCKANFIEITLRHGCSPVNLLHISRILFYKSTSGGLFLHRIIIITNLNFFFYMGFWLQGKGEAILLSPHYHFHPLQRHLDISRVITAESSPQHIAGSGLEQETFGLRAQVANQRWLIKGRY